MTRPRILLINPRITSNARFPLAVMTLATALSAHHETRIIDGNVDRDFIATAVTRLRRGECDAVGISVMGGPQLLTAAALSNALRTAAPHIPIIWGGYFPTQCPDAALNSDHVDYVVRGQGEGAFIELLDAVFKGQTDDLSAIDGLSWRDSTGTHVHNKDRSFSTASQTQALNYDSVDRPQQYLRRTYLGRRTTCYQAALGCRFRCTFCGVAAMFHGKTALPPAERLDRDLDYLKTRFGADSVQYYDNNFFDREVEMQPLLQVMAKHALPWWCFARADALLGLSEASWTLVRKSRLRMAYIGAESPNDQVLHDMRKGTSADQTLAVVEKCRSNGVTPELSFMLAPPHDPEGETERTFEFIRQIKRLHPATEVMLYVNTPLPPRRHPGSPLKQRPLQLLRDLEGRKLVFPDTIEGWSEQSWQDYWCHYDAPWVSARLHRRILDFTTVLGCRFPTITDTRAAAWQKAALRMGSAWRYRMQRYDRPWELQLMQKFVRLWDPRVMSL